MMNDDVIGQLVAAASTHPSITAAHMSDGGDAVVLTVSPSGTEYPVPLRRLRTRLGQMPTDGDRRAHIENLLAAVVETDQTVSEPWDTTRLLAARPMLFSAHKYVRHTDQVSGVEIVPGVLQAAVRDRETTIAHIPPSMLEEWDTDVDEVLKAARRNLDLAPDEDLGWLPMAGNLSLHELSPVDDYAANLAFDPGWWPAGLPGAGPVAFVVPDRNTVLAGRVRSIEHALVKIAEVSLRVWRESADPVSPVVYTVVDGQIRPLEARPARARAALAKNRVVLIGSAYRQQEESVPAPEGGWYAPFDAGEDRAGVLVSRTAWDGRSLDCLLPRADVVDLAVGTVLSWEEFMTRATGAVRLERGVVPARWRTVGVLG